MHAHARKKDKYDVYLFFLYTTEQENVRMYVVYIIFLV